MKRILTAGFALLLAGSFLLPARAAEVNPMGTQDAKYFISKDGGSQTRSVPEVTDFRNVFGVGEYGYPAFDTNYDESVKAAYLKKNPTATNEQVAAEVAKVKAAVYEETVAIFDYDAMDQAGNLYKNGQRKAATQDGKTVTQLVNHTAGQVNFGETIPASAPSVTKHISLRTVAPRGNVALGLYAAPGEVVTIKVTSKTPGTNLELLIGGYGGTSQSKNIDAGYKYVRMPINGKGLNINNETNYVGSPIGGPMYLVASQPGAIVEMTISGAIEMPTYIHGITTEDQLTNMLMNSYGPYVDIATPRGLRIMGPGKILPADRFTNAASARSKAKDIMASADFWDKAINVSYQFGTGHFGDGTNADSQKMSIVFDPHIPAGAALNYGGSFCACPVGWAGTILNPNAMIAGGNWGNLHEINHSFKWGGCTDAVTEISNNVVSAMTYLLYSNVAASRTELGGLSGWNWCSDAYYTMKFINNKRSQNPPQKADNLEAYMPVMQSFGTDRFLTIVDIFHENGGQSDKSVPTANFSTNSDIWLYASSKATGYDMTYYMRDVLGFKVNPDYTEGEKDYLTQKVLDRVQKDGANVFIPSGLLYQSGYLYNKGTLQEELVETGRAFRIPFGRKKLLNLHTTENGGYLCVPKGVSAELLEVGTPQHGKLEQKEDKFQLVYTPSREHLEDWFYVTMRLTINDEGEYNGRYQDITYKIHLLQETSGFSTEYYKWEKPGDVSNADAIKDAIGKGALDQESLGGSNNPYIGFEIPNGATELHKTLAVSEGRIIIETTGELDLYARGDDFFAVYATTEKEEDTGEPIFPADPYISHNSFLGQYQIYEKQTTEQGRKLADATRMRLYILNEGEEAPVNPEQYDVIMKKGDILYLRAYVLNTGGAGGFRMGYLTTRIENGQTIYEVKDFDGSVIRNIYSSDDNLTPDKGDYETEKEYTYNDDTYQHTEVTAEEIVTPKGLRVEYVRETGKDTDLPVWSGNGKENILDDDNTTFFHGDPRNKNYSTDFVFAMDEAATFNAFKYIGHVSNQYGGKIKDYEIYAGESLEDLAKEENLVASGTVTTTKPNAGRYDLIRLGKPITAQYFKIVAKTAHPTNGQYYVAMSDFKLINETTIEGVGKIEDIGGILSDTDWNTDTDTNTRFGLHESNIGTGTVEFEGVGVILYSTKGKKYGTMVVQLDNQPAVEVDLHSDYTQHQQVVFWQNDLDPEGKHTLTFQPKTPGTDWINVEYVEIKHPKYEDELPVSVPDKTPPIFNEDGIYAGEDDQGIYQLSYRWEGEVYPENRSLPQNNREYKSEAAAKRAVDKEFTDKTVVVGSRLMDGATEEVMGEYVFSGWRLDETLEEEIEAAESENTEEAAKEEVSTASTMAVNAEAENTEEPPKVRKTLVYSGTWTFEPQEQPGWKVEYNWNANVSEALKKQVTLPVDETIYDSKEDARKSVDTTYEATDIKDEISDSQNGIWIFQGWKDAESVSELQKKIIFTGEWKFHEVDKTTWETVYLWKGDYPEGYQQPENQKGFTSAAAARASLDKTYDDYSFYGQSGNLKGTWTFRGWEERKTATNAVVFVGTWNFEAGGEAPKTDYTIRYEWGDMAPPLATLPQDGNTYANVERAKEAVDKEYTKGKQMPGMVDGYTGIWTFSGWTANDVPNIRELYVTGSWKFQRSDDVDPDQPTDKEELYTVKYVLDGKAGEDYPKNLPKLPKDDRKYASVQEVIENMDTVPDIENYVQGMYARGTNAKGQEGIWTFIAWNMDVDQKNKVVTFAAKFTFVRTDFDNGSGNNNNNSGNNNNTGNKVPSKDYGSILEDFLSKLEPDKLPSGSVGGSGNTGGKGTTSGVKKPTVPKPAGKDGEAAEDEGIQYTVLEGHEAEWERDKDGGLQFRVDAEFSKFKKVYVNDRLVNERDYTASEGSTIIRLKPEYMATLAVKEHEIKIVFEDGVAKATFEVVSNEEEKTLEETPEEETEATDSDAEVVEDTEDTEVVEEAPTEAAGTTNGNLMLWLIVLVALVAIIVVVIIVIVKKKRDSYY